jgi:hypothetical protein
VPDGFVGFAEIVAGDFEACGGKPGRGRASDDPEQQGLGGGGTLIVGTLRRHALERPLLAELGDNIVAEIE